MSQKNRQEQLALLAKSPYEKIVDLWSSLNINVQYHCLKKPETGMVMVKAQAGGDGQPFNMGEMTVTRTVVQLENEQLGFGYCSGRDHKKSELVAVIDALLQTEDYGQLLQEKVIDPLFEEMESKNRQYKEKTDNTKVNFFTMVRGD